MYLSLPGRLVQFMVGNPRVLVQKVEVIFAQKCTPAVVRQLTQNIGQPSRTGCEVRAVTTICFTLKAAACLILFLKPFCMVSAKPN